MSIPGIGPIISSAMVAAIGLAMDSPRAAILPPGWGSSPGKSRRATAPSWGKISKRGNRYLRVLFVQAAWVALVKVKPNRWEGHGLKPWIETAKKRLHHNVLAIAGLPTSSHASRGAFLLVVERSRRASFKPRDHSRLVAYLPAGVCERMR